jgi:tight adherence protein B
VTVSAAASAALLAAAALGVLALPRGAALRLPDVVPSGGRLASRARVGAGTRTVGGVALAGLLTGVVVGPVPALLAALVAAAGARARRRHAAAAGRRQERARAVEACGALAAELRAGRSPAEALAAAAEVATGPSRSALVHAAGAAGLGSDPAAALRGEGSAGTAVPDVLRALAACWTVCAGSGGGLAAAAERLEQGLRADQAQRRAVAAELAGPRATAGLLAVLPVAGLLLAAGLGADPLHVLLHTPIGLVCLTAGLLLDGLGLWWTGRLVARAGGTS